MQRENNPPPVTGERYPAIVAAVRSAERWFATHNPVAGMYHVTASGQPMLSLLRGVLGLPAEQRTLPVLFEATRLAEDWMCHWIPAGERYGEGAPDTRNTYAELVLANAEITRLKCA